jgi:hypothetical protein
MKKSIMAAMIILGALGAQARNGDGGYAGAFLRMGIGSRAQALGDAFSAIPEGAIAGIYNPALLPHLAHRQLSLSYGHLPLDRSTSYVGFAQPLQPKQGEDGTGLLKAGFSLAWLRAGVNNIDGRDLSGNSIGTFSNSEDAFYFSFAMAPLPKFSIGLSAKVLYNRMPGLANDNSAITSKGFGIDIGAYFSPYKDISLGLVLRDNNSKYTWNTDKLWDRGTSTTYQFPRVLRAAAAYRIPQKWLLVIAELEDSKEQNPRYHMGAEFSYADVGAVQIGLDDSRPCFGLQFGANVFSRRTTLNYAYVFPNDGPGADHVFTWGFEF